MQFVNEAPNYFEDTDSLDVKSQDFERSCESLLSGIIGSEIKMKMISELDIPDYMLYTMLGGRLDTAKGIMGNCNANIFINWALGIVPHCPRLVDWMGVARNMPANADRVSVAKYLVYLVEIIEGVPVLSLGRKVIDSWFAVAAMTDDMMLLDYLLGEGYGTNSHLRFFVGYGRAELIQRMLDHGFDGRGSDPYHKLILSFDRCLNLPSLLRTKENEDLIFNLLINDIGGTLPGFDLEELNKSSLSPFSYAVWRGDLTLAKILLRSGINLNNFLWPVPVKPTCLWDADDDSEGDDTDDDNANSVEEDEGNEDSDAEVTLDEFANPIDEWDDSVHDAYVFGGNYVHLAIHSRCAEMVAFIRDVAAPLLPGSWLFSVNYQTHVVLPPIEHAANLAAMPRHIWDHAASEADSLAVMKEVLLFKDIDVNLVPLRKLSMKKTILHTLFKFRYPPSLLQLILEDKRVDVNARDANGRTPMHFAIHASPDEDEYIAEEKLNMLLCFDRSSNAPLDRVVKYFEEFDFRGQSYDEGDYPIVAINPNERADCETRDHSGMTPIQMDGYDVNILRPRIRTASVNADGSLNVTWQRGCDPNKRFAFRDPSIFDSVLKVPSLIAHLRYGANVDSVGYVSGQTPLQHYLKRSSENIAALLSVMPLLHFGSSVSHRDADGRTALHIIATKKCRGVTTALSDFGVDLDARDKNGLTPLHMACSGNNTALVGWLLGEGADPNVADNSGWTPLHSAATNCYNDCVSLLLEWRANPNAKTNTGKTPLHCLAKCLKNVDEHKVRRMTEARAVAENLISHGCDPTVLDVKGFNVMLLAGTSGNSVIVDFLLNEPNDPSTYRCSAHPGSASVCHALCRCLPDKAARSVLNAALLAVRKQKEGAKRNREHGQSIDEQQSRADAEAVQPVPRTE